MDEASKGKLEFAKKHRFRSLKLLDVDLDKELGDKPFGADYGKLENGLTYYVRCNAKPQMRAALALAVKVGSVLEEETERGVAHIVEHLAFSATKNYTNHDIVKFLESIGADLGACGNAYTSCDETVYELFVPIDKPGLLSKAISILAEFSSEIRISAEDLEKERGAVLEEYRGGRNASGRLWEARWVSILEGSKYAERLAVGLEKVIRTVPCDVVKQFYKKWYSLHNMAIIAVGDFTDTQIVIQLIREHFGEMNSSLKPPISPTFEVPLHKEPRYLCFAESEAAGSRVMVSWKTPKGKFMTVKDYRDWLVEIMFICALNQRFYKISYRKDPPYFTCSAAEHELVNPIKAFKISASCREKRTIEALESILIELARIRTHGFSEREIFVARALTLSEIESAYLEREKMQSSTLRYQYVEHYLCNSPIVGVEFEAQLQKTMLPQISASEVSKYAQKFQTSCSCVITISEPHATVAVEDLKAVVLKINSLEEERNVSAWDNGFIPEEIVHVKPSPGTVLVESEYPVTGVTELILSNGMRVCCKCTDFKNDQVIFEGYSYGGYSELQQSDYLSCIKGSAIAGEIGKFGHKPSVLVDMLAGKRAEVSTNLGAYTRTFFGDCSPSDLETALQLVYQLFVTNVEPRDEDIKTVMQLSEENIRADQRDPHTAFWNRVRRLKYGNSYFYRPIQIRDLPKIDPRKACEYFDNCFKDPSTFTVVIVGNIDLVTGRPLILEYLGGIPKPPQPIFHINYDDLKGLPSTCSTRAVREVVRSTMVEAQCAVHLSFPVKLTHETIMEEMYFVQFVIRLLEIKMMQVLRFKHGQIYTAEVSSNFGHGKPSRSDDLYGYISIDFSCDPSVSSALIDVALNEILRLQENGPSEEDISAVLEIERRAHENGLQENYYWLYLLSCSYNLMFYSGDVDCSFQALDKARSRVRQSLTLLTAKWSLQRILPCPCKELYTAVILIPRTTHFDLLNSFPQHAKILAGLAGLTVLAVNFWRHARQT
ncbi:hypothetical protein Ancab_016933 [Ancistrocladus abbreviatus]